MRDGFLTSEAKAESYSFVLAMCRFLGGQNRALKIPMNLTKFAHVNIQAQMTIQEAIQKRHSVRQYIDKNISEDVVAALKAKIDEVNDKSGLHIQLILNEPKSFQCAMAKYGHFSGVNSYLVMAGKKTHDLDEKVGYYGEQIVLLAQMLGLNTCWVGISYSKIPDTYVLNEGEKIACYVSLGYGVNQGFSHKIRSVKEVSNASDDCPKWFIDGVNAALLAPTAVNQQKFFFEYTTGDKVIARSGFSLVGYTRMDLGIAKYHFEVGAGKENFEWADCR